MNRTGKHFTWLLMLLASLVLTSASLFAHNPVKPTQTVLKATVKANVEMLAEIEEDETEGRGHEQFVVLPLLHFLYSIEFFLADFHGQVKPGEKPLCTQNIPFQSLLCVFRI